MGPSGATDCGSRLEEENAADLPGRNGRKFRTAINGFGRIGRQVARILSTRRDCPLQLTAINTMENVETAAHLLSRDSIYGPFPGRVEVAKDGNNLRINGEKVLFLNQDAPDRLPWASEGIDLVIDSSGADAGAARRHLQAGASRVLVTRSAAGVDATLSMGINHAQYDPRRHHLISASSCTATCIAPVARIVNELFGINQIMTCVVHSYTNQQNILDAGNLDLRLARAAAVNMIPTRSSGTDELEKLLPELRGKINVMAVRVPTPVVHNAHFVARVKRKSDRNELLAAFDAAASGGLAGIMAVNRRPLVSSDFIGNPCSSIVDAEFTACRDDLVNVVIWHDNEHGYSSRVVDLGSHLVTAG